MRLDKSFEAFSYSVVWPTSKNFKDYLQVHNFDVISISNADKILILWRFQGFYQYFNHFVLTLKLYDFK